MEIKRKYDLPEEHSRTARVVGTKGVKRLQNAHVAVFGVGGVGGHCVEALARAGVGHLTIIDGDVVSLSNINRQTIALHSTVGRPKVEVMAERIRDINPDCEVTPIRLYYLPETQNRVELEVGLFDYVADCIDSLMGKLLLATLCPAYDIPIISAMAAGNKIYPERFVITDVFKTNTDPIAKIMRKELRARGIHKLKVVCSDETPLPISKDSDIENTKASPHSRPSPGSLSFVPATMGLLMAGEIIRHLSGTDEILHEIEEEKAAKELARQEAAEEKKKQWKETFGYK